MSVDQNCILFFVKSPKQGQVKRRLATSLGETVATALYTTFVCDALATLDTCGARVVVCFSPPEAKKSLVAWLGQHYAYLPQRGGDLGQRMNNGFIDTFGRGFQQVIIVGSDIPDLPRDVIEDAFASLETRDAVLGPSFDGGYYLIGFKRDTFQPLVFEGIRWGTETVFQETINRFRAKGLSLDILPTWNDIDTLIDLKDFFQRNRQTASSSSQTISYILENAALRGSMALFDSCDATEDRSQNSEGKGKITK